MKKISFAISMLLFCSAFATLGHLDQSTLFLVDGDWTQTQYLTDEDNDGVFEDTSLPCQIGDVWRFTPDHKFEWRDEAEFCDADADSVSIITGVWQMRNNNTELYMEVDPVFINYHFLVKTLTANTLELRLLNDDPSTYAPAEERLVFTR